jgi:hypothetical protein
MIWSLTATKDTTIYESDPYRNTGLDQILEISKAGDSTSGDLVESRALVQFDISQLSNILSEHGLNINNISASLRLYTVQESELAETYTIEARPISEQWANGSGYSSNIEAASTLATDGATWITTEGSGSTEWFDAIGLISQTGSYNTEEGGGYWYTASVATQTFNFKSNDTIDIDVSSIVRSWYNNFYANYGFIVSLNNSEINAPRYPNTNIQLYSLETHTVFEPQLYISWTGSVSYSTGSMTVATFEDNPILYTRSFKNEFKKDTKCRIMLGARPKYPRPTFQQNSSFATIKALPEESYYQIVDAHNQQVIIPYSANTKISSNSNGAYFDFYTTMMYPERYYRFEIKAIFSDFTEYFDANEFIFKVVN